MDEVSLIIGGTAYQGWQTVSVTQSLEQVASQFNLGYQDQATESQQPLAINEEDLITVKFDSDVVVTGYSDDGNQTHGVGERSSSVNGMSLLGDLISCAAIHKSGQWSKATLAAIVKDIIQPFGLKMRVDATAQGATAPFGKFTLQDAETAFEAIDRAAKMRAILVTSDPDGTLVLTRAGASRSGTTLRYGENVKWASRTWSGKDTFSEYILKAQLPGTDLLSGKPAGTIKASVTDTRVKRYRPTIIMAETEDSKKELTDRATWERNVRWGRSRRYSCRLQGWRDNDAKLWKPNTLVRCVDPEFNLDDTLLIVSVQFTRTLEDGTVTTLELTRKEAFDLVPVPAKKPKGKGLFDGLGGG